MQDQQVVLVVDNAPAVFEGSNNMDVGFDGHWSIPPGPAKVHEHSCLFFLDLEIKDLNRVSQAYEIRIDIDLFFSLASIRILILRIVLNLCNSVSLNGRLLCGLIRS